VNRTDRLETNDVALPEQQTALSSTRELDARTIKGGRHVPRYSDFVPASASNRHPTEHASGSRAHENLKAEMQLSVLDRYSPDSLPGYTGHRPQSTRNMRKLDPPTNTTMTTRMLSRGRSRECVRLVPEALGPVKMSSD